MFYFKLLNLYSLHQTRMNLIRLLQYAGCILMGISVCFLTGCASTKDRAGLVTMEATKMINPNQEEQPTPVVVTLYQLKDDTIFNQADFFNLYRDAQGTLGSSYISSQQSIIAPGTTQKVDIQIKPESKFLGVIAAFQKRPQTGWQSTLSLNKSQQNFKVELDKTTVTLDQ